MERRADIDQAKGLAILLVVFGHIVARADPLGVGWYEPLRRAVYAFHMPFFLYLSGLVVALSGAAQLPQAAWRGFAVQRAKRLLLPFLAMGMLSIFGKMAAERLMFVDHVPAGLAAGLDGLFWHTANSPNGSVWYLWVLFLFSIAAPVLWAACGGWVWVLAVGLYFVPLPPLFYADHVARYALFFAAGILAGMQWPHWTALIDRHWRWLLGIFALGFVSIVLFGKDWPVAVTLLPMGLVSMPALHGLVRYSRPYWCHIFQWLGRYCFMIYLFNTISIGLAKGLLLHVSDWDGVHFVPFAIVLMLSGCLLPVGLKVFVLRRVKGLDRATD
ncbi:MAG TPA: acyltransferase [Acidocella sp.]|nr:MAG: hypothetical protein B7Z71_01310 [Acidocella sp. 21-58-7]HQT65042.1 acyltransferase [Acidocella sp.]HQU03481.1 acyltransferase [Acidocella sp.]